MHSEPTVGLPAVRRLYEVSVRMAAGRSLAETLQAVVDGVVDGLGFGVAALSLRLPDGKFEMVAVAGSEDARAALLGTVNAANHYDAELAIADVWGGLRFVPHERLPEGEPSGWVPDVPVSSEPDAWHPVDALYAPLHAPAGELVGMLSVDLPEDRRRPGPVRRELLEIFATQAGLAIEKARLTDLLRAEKARLEASEATFRLVFEGSGNGMATLGVHSPDAGRLLQVNPAFCRITGYRADQLIGTAFVSYLDEEDAGTTRRGIEAAAESDEPYRFERRFRRADGTAIWLGGTATGVTAGAASEQHFVLIHIDDVTARKDAERELQHEAGHDPLTGLPNRRVLARRFEAALRRCRQTGSPGALLFCDLDHFKAVNDRYGHETGDRVLKMIADRLLGQVRHGDTVARLGGDEFAVLAEDIHGDDLDALVRRIEEAVAAPLPGIDVRVRASVGAATIDREVSNLEELLRAADTAMYDVKRARGD